MAPAAGMEDVLAARVREKVLKAAGILERQGALPDRVEEAWWHLRPLYPNAVPGQAGLTAEQRLGLQGVLDLLGGRRGAGASGAEVRKRERKTLERAAIGMRRLAEALGKGSPVGARMGGIGV